jgi:hypothetical protein
MTKNAIRRLRSEGVHVSRHIEKFLLHEYVEECFPYGWNDEDEAYHEIRDVVDAYAHTSSAEFFSGKYDRLIEVRDTLKEMYVDLLCEYREMESKLRKDYDDGNSGATWF